MLHAKDVMVKLMVGAKAQAEARRKDAAIVRGLRDLLAITAWAAVLQAEVVDGIARFFEMQQVCWLWLEEKQECPLGKMGLKRAACCSAVETCEECLPVPGPIEDVTNSNSDPEEYYPIVGTEDVPATHKEEVVNPVEAITELKQEAGRVVRARVIEFRAESRTYTRIVRKADAAAFAAIKADIKLSFLGEGKFKDGAVEAFRLIIPTLKVRPGFVYVRV